MKKTETPCTCKECTQPYYKKEVIRVYGKDSMVSLLNFCSSQCYTKNLIRKQVENK